MPGYAIHIAIANKYIWNHPRVNNIKEFINGVIAPDLTDDKNETHYSKSGSAHTNLLAFLESNEIDTSFNQGYFLHLITDYLFYNKYFTNYSKDLYEDYDILNKEIIEKYKVVLPTEVEKYVNFKSGKLKILEREKLENMIKEISEKSLEEYKEEILGGKL